MAIRIYPITDLTNVVKSYQSETLTDNTMAEDGREQMRTFNVIHSVGSNRKYYISFRAMCACSYCCNHACTETACPLCI